jgi:hypothetical protein
MKFYLMWANHDVNHSWDVRNAGRVNQVIWKGTVTEDVYHEIVERWITKYFSHPSYYKINGSPVFMLYNPENFVKSFGGLDGAKKAIAYFRSEVKKAGYPGLHLQMVATRNNAKNFSGVDTPMKDTEVYRALDIDSLTHYQWVSFADPDRDYSEWAAAALAEYNKMDEEGATYFPHVSLGWDNNPRFLDYRPGVVKNATPDKIEEAFRRAKEYVDTHNLPAPLITVNSWNEWTESSYLEPDTKYGYGYLEAIKKVFLDEE